MKKKKNISKRDSNGINLKPTKKRKHNTVSFRKYVISLRCPENKLKTGLSKKTHQKAKKSKKTRKTKENSLKRERYKNISK